MKRIVVYAGPTISAERVAQILPQADVRGPLRRGDLYRLAQDEGASVSCVLVIDGLFGSNFAATAGEFLDVQAAGLQLIGTASLGAVRAVECAPFGVRGHGRIYEAFLAGSLTSDGEVAVGLDPDSAYRSTSIALVDARFAAAALRDSGKISDGQENDVVATISECHYLERSETLVRHLLVDEGILTESQFSNWKLSLRAKLDDAERCLSALAEGRFEEDGIRSSPLVSRINRRDFPSPIEGCLNESAAEANFVDWAIRNRRISVDGRHRSTPIRGSKFVQSVIEQLWSDGALDSELLLWRATEGG